MWDFTDFEKNGINRKKWKSIHLIRKFKGIENAINGKILFQEHRQKKVSPGGMKKRQ